MKTKQEITFSTNCQNSHHYQKSNPLCMPVWYEQNDARKQVTCETRGWTTQNKNKEEEEEESTESQKNMQSGAVSYLSQSSPKTIHGTTL